MSVHVSTCKPTPPHWWSLAPFSSDDHVVSDPAGEVEIFVDTKVARWLFPKWAIVDVYSFPFNKSLWWKTQKVQQETSLAGKKFLLLMNGQCECWQNQNVLEFKEWWHHSWWEGLERKLPRIHSRVLQKPWTTHNILYHYLFVSFWYSSRGGMNCFLFVGNPMLPYYYHPNSMTSGFSMRAHSWWCLFYKFERIFNEEHPSGYLVISLQ